MYGFCNVWECVGMVSVMYGSVCMGSVLYGSVYVWGL